MPRTYHEGFENDRGGWFGWESNSLGPRQLEHNEFGVTSRSPWWIDYNHAPPGEGYLHLLFALMTKGPSIPERYVEIGGSNRFIAEPFPTDFTNARLTFELSGELETRGANLCLLVQASVDGRVATWALTSQPIEVSEQLNEQTVTCVPDESQWTCLGARHDRSGMYAAAPLYRVLEDVNTNIILVLFPLTIAPMGPIPGDPHLLRAGKDYPVWTSQLPEGYVMLREVHIEFA